ncbi:f-boxkelch-repeat protein, partial [Nicotiana attenuata]
LLNISGKFVNGKLHWATMAPGPNRCMFGNIISFDLADEKWENVELPCYGRDEIALFWLGLLGSDLSIICDRRGTHVDVWVMKEYWVTKSWTKMFVIKHPDDQVDHPCFPPFFMSNEGEILVVFGSTFMIYNPKDESFKSLDVINSDYWQEAEIYVKSLVCP